MKRLLTLTAAAVVISLAGAGCGDDATSSADDGGSTSTTTAPPGSSTIAAADPSPSSAGPTLALATSELGRILVDGAGRTLYLFTPDTGTTSTCTGSCAQAWPALTGTAVAGDGLAAEDLGTATRADGATQVTFRGHPLYYFAGDDAAGDTKGQGTGGKWYVVDAEGMAVHGASSGGGTPTPPTSGAARSGY